MARAQEFETITMPTGGLGSFITSNLDEIDDNILMFGSGSGINSMKEVADRMAKLGREGDTFVVHASEKEVMVPKEVAEKNPDLVAEIKNAIAAEGADPEAYIVGSANNSINPMTGQREFFLKKLVKGIKKVLKKSAKIILPVAINFLAPGLGTIASAAIGAGVGGLIQGESFGEALKSAALGGITAGVASGVSGMLGGGTFMEGVQGGLPASYRPGSGIAGIIPNKSDFALRFGKNTPSYSLNPLKSGYAANQTFASAGGDGIAGVPTPQQAADAVKYQTNMANLGTPVTNAEALKAVSGMGFGKKALLYAGLGLGTAAATGAFDEIPAGEIDLTDLGVNVGGGDGSGDLGANPLMSGTALFNQNPAPYTISQPAPTTFFSPNQIMVPGANLYGTGPGSLSNLYANLTPVGAGTITPAATTTQEVTTPTDPEVAQVQLAGFDQRFTGMAPAELYGLDASGGVILSPYREDEVVQQAEFVADGGPMSREGQRNMALSDFPRRTGDIQGPGTETSDDIPAMLSDGEFVMTARAVRGAGDGDRQKGFKKMYDIMRSFEGGAVA